MVDLRHIDSVVPPSVRMQAQQAATLAEQQGYQIRALLTYLNLEAKDWIKMCMAQAINPKGEWRFAPTDLAGSAISSPGRSDGEGKEKHHRKPDPARCQKKASAAGYRAWKRRLQDRRAEFTSIPLNQLDVHLHAVYERYCDPGVLGRTGSSVMTVSGLMRLLYDCALLDNITTPYVADSLWLGVSDPAICPRAATMDYAQFRDILARIASHRAAVREALKLPAWKQDATPAIHEQPFLAPFLNLTLVNRQFPEAPPRKPLQRQASSSSQDLPLGRSRGSTSDLNPLKSGDGGTLQPSRRSSGAQLNTQASNSGHVAFSEGGLKPMFSNSYKLHPTLSTSSVHSVRGAIAPKPQVKVDPVVQHWQVMIKSWVLPLATTTGTQHASPLDGLFTRQTLNVLRVVEPELRRLFSWYCFLDEPSEMPWLCVVREHARMPLPNMVEMLCNFKVTPSFMSRTDLSSCYAMCPSMDGRQGLYDGGQVFSRFLLTLAVTALRIAETMQSRIHAKMTPEELRDFRRFCAGIGPAQVRDDMEMYLSDAEQQRRATLDDDGLAQSGMQFFEYAGKGLEAKRQAQEQADVLNYRLKVLNRREELRQHHALARLTNFYADPSKLATSPLSIPHPRPTGHGLHEPSSGRRFESLSPPVPMETHGGHGHHRQRRADGISGRDPLDQQDSPKIPVAFFSDQIQIKTPKINTQIVTQSSSRSYLGPMPTYSANGAAMLSVPEANNPPSAHSGRLGTDLSASQLPGVLQTADSAALNQHLSRLGRGGPRVIQVHVIEPVDECDILNNFTHKLPSIDMKPRSASPTGSSWSSIRSGTRKKHPLKQLPASSTAAVLPNRQTPLTAEPVQLPPQQQHLVQEVVYAAVPLPEHTHLPYPQQPHPAGNARTPPLVSPPRSAHPAHTHTLDGPPTEHPPHLQEHQTQDLHRFMHQQGVVVDLSTDEPSPGRSGHSAFMSAGVPKAPKQLPVMKRHDLPTSELLSQALNPNDSLIRSLGHYSSFHQEPASPLFKPSHRPGRLSNGPHSPLPHPEVAALDSFNVPIKALGRLSAELKTVTNEVVLTGRGSQHWEAMYPVTPPSPLPVV